MGADIEHGILTYDQSISGLIEGKGAGGNVKVARVFNSEVSALAYDRKYKRNIDR